MIGATFKSQSFMPFSTLKFMCQSLFLQVRESYVSPALQICLWVQKKPSVASHLKLSWRDSQMCTSSTTTSIFYFPNLQRCFKAGRLLSSKSTILTLCLLSPSSRTLWTPIRKALFWCNPLLPPTETQEEKKKTRGMSFEALPLLPVLWSGIRKPGTATIWKEKEGEKHGLSGRQGPEWATPPSHVPFDAYSHFFFSVTEVQV